MSLLKKSLRVAAKGLIFISESDAPLVAVHLTDAEFNALDRTRPVPLATFFSPMTTPQPWHGEEERKSVERFARLVEALAKIDGATAYRQSDGPDIEVVIVGKDPSGGYTGVRTRLTET